MSLADRLAKASQRDRIADVRLRVQERLVEVLGPALVRLHALRQRARRSGPPASARAARRGGGTALLAGEAPHRPADRRQRAGTWDRSSRSSRDPDVSEIMVNGWDTIYVERAGKLYWTGTKFHDEQQLRRTIDKIVGKVGRRVDEASPYVDARLPDGSRVNAIIPPLSIDGPALTIRKFSADPFGADDLIEFGTMTSQVSQFLECLRPRTDQHPGLRRNRRREDLDPERPLVVHPGRRTHHHDRRRGRAASAAAARDPPGVPARRTSRARDRSRSATWSATPCVCGLTGSSSVRSVTRRPWTCCRP